MEPGMLYVVGPKDRHSIRADTGLLVISISTHRFVVMSNTMAKAR